MKNLGYETSGSDDFIFASAFAAQAPMVDGEDVIFASTLPRVAAPASRPRAEPMDIDHLWAAFDAELAEDIARGLCPHCGSPLDVDPAREDVSCGTCGSAFAAFHAWVRQGNA